MSREEILKVKEKLNSVSPCFCMAKWMHTTLHLLNGTNHSCYLPPPHKIPLEELAANPAALHNSNHKKEQRRLMLKGERPAECGMCWSIEDLGGDHLSDRILRGTETWTAPYFEEVVKTPWDANVYPSYLEVSFSANCNFKCSYCSPHVSTRWLQEIREHGGYKLSEGLFQTLEYLQTAGMMPIEDEEQNPYVKAFWEWWPEVYRKLKVFRITGGEPLLSPSTWRVIDYINANPNPELELDVNSNFGVSQVLIDKLLTAVEGLLREKKIKSFRLHTSVDTFGPQAEYIRHGLNFDQFKRNVENYLRRIPSAHIAFMCTYNVLSVVGFRGLLEWVLSLREEFHFDHRRVSLDIPHLTGPTHLSARILTPDFHEYIRQDMDYMRDRLGKSGADTNFRHLEVAKLERILSWLNKGESESELKKNRRDFYLFFSEHDRRRKTDFLKTFPQMKDFWQLCQEI